MKHEDIDHTGLTGISSGSVATDAIWDAAGDLAVGSGANTAAKLTVGAVGKLLQSDGTTVVYAAGTKLPLDYALAADVTNQAITAFSYFDVFANQNFAVTSATSIIEITVRGYGFMADNTSAQAICRINVDSGGTPILKYMSSGANNSGSSQARQNVLQGGSVFLSGLSVATHTLKVQVTNSQNDHFYCRASTAGPPSNGSEFLNVQVVEHL